MVVKHKVSSIEFSDTVMRVWVDGRKIDLELVEVSSKQAGATETQRSNFVVSPSGYGVRWPDLDEDLSVEGLLGGEHSTP